MLQNEREKIRHLLVVQDLKGQRTIPLLEATYSLGRDSRNAIVLQSRSVSRQHAILLRVTIPNTDQYAFRIIDGNFKGKRSTNGLFVNGSKCFSHHLQHGDVMAFGNHKAQAKYYAISNLSEAAFSESCDVVDISEFLSEQGGSVNPVDTFIVHDGNAEGASEAALTRLASFPELIPNPIIEMDLDGQVTYLNPAAAKKFVNIRATGQNHPILAKLLQSVVNLQDKSFVREVTVGGEIFEQSVHYLPESDLIRTFIIRDITEQKQAEAELIHRDRLLQAVAEAANYLLVEMDFEIAIEKVLATLGEAANVDHVYFFQNSPAQITGEIIVTLQFEWNRSTLGASRESWQDQSYAACGIERWYQKLSNGELISGIIQEFPPEEQALLHRFNIQSLLLVPLLLEEEFWGYLGIADCTSMRRWSKHEESSLLAMSASINGARQRHQVEARIRYQAMHDLLTGLPNRWYLNDILAKSIDEAIKQQESLAVILLDLDRFKVINDTLGHTVGDELLQCVARRLLQSLRHGDVITRWGGDEFTIVLPEIHQIEVEIIQIADKILASLEKSFHLQGHELYVSASLGIALLNEHSPDAETLIRHADTALFYAKDAGRNNYKLYDVSINTVNSELLGLEKSLRHALDRKELEVYYQPRVNILTEKITGMEALLRWNHPEMGLVSPNIFIPLAEENGLIIPIGEWAIREACNQNKIWQLQGLSNITIAVNLSPKQFRQPNLVETIAKILEETQLDPQFLELEITETIAIENIDFIQNILNNLAQMGVNLSIDDFGIKESNLSRLQSLPLHNLKIDKFFIQELTTNTKTASIIRGIVSIGHDLGLRLIAEGVEKREELDFLKSIKCDDVQGYLFYKPLRAQDATALILSQGK